jgi:hypothetical protein
MKTKNISHQHTYWLIPTNTFIQKYTTLRIHICNKAVVRRCVGGAKAPPEFGVPGKRTEREMDSLLLSAPPDLKT